MGGGVRLLFDALVVLLVTMTGIAAISAWVFAMSIKEGDSASAWIWAVVFLVASILDTWAFWRLV
jgi:uncharacterized membrane protein YgaE (UPF0421/DUF939 family)